MGKGEVLITGSAGTIGSVLRSGLAEAGYSVRQFDKHLGDDALDYGQVYERSAGCHSVVHLAWETERDNYGKDEAAYREHNADANSLIMTRNVLTAAKEAGARRVVIASSIHADMPVREPGGMRWPYRLPEPDSLYGAGKVYAEALGRYFARHHDLEVVCIRLGWVAAKADARPDPNTPYPAGEGWLSHGDFVRLFDAALAAPEVPDNYAIVYGLSRRDNDVHDLSNPFGYVPRDTYKVN